MAKYPVDWLELIVDANTSTNYRAYGHPFAEGKIIVGRLAFPRGKMPKHLEPYKGQVAKVAQKCKGKRGKEFVRCLIVESAKMGITRNPRKLERAKTIAGELELKKE